jgi:FixJ family two-component response regulator
MNFNMETYRVLIVDDQREVRRVLRSAINTLGSEIEVIDVPSAEEALLEMSTTASFDLLVVDILLPGMSGLELLEKLQGKNPDMRVILVTGVMDTKTRQQVADAGACAFFLKPIETADFLDAVERCLGIIEAPPIEQDERILGKPTENVSERLAGLRQEMDAFSAVMLDERGRVLARAGDLPDASVETALFPALMAAYSASEKVAKLMRTNPPSDLMYFSGSKYDLFLAHVGASYALLVATNPIATSDQVDTYVRIVHEGLKELLMILSNMGIPLTSEEHTPAPTETTPEEEPIAEAEDAPMIEALFQRADSASITSEEADAFWDTVSQGESEGDIGSADELSYDQARQLGLTPEDGSEE